MTEHFNDYNWIHFYNCKFDKKILIILFCNSIVDYILTGMLFDNVDIPGLSF